MEADYLLRNPCTVKGAGQDVMADRDQAIAAALDELIEAAANLPPERPADQPSATLVARNRRGKSSRSRRSAGKGR